MLKEPLEVPEAWHHRNSYSSCTARSSGAQGTSAKEAATYDFSEKVAAKQGATPKSPPVQQPPAGPRKSKTQQKGKKKGGKNRF